MNIIITINLILLILLTLVGTYINYQINHSQYKRKWELKFRTLVKWLMLTFGILVLMLIIKYI